MTDTEQVVNLDAVVAELHKRGHAAYVEQTGGGCATIYAGPSWPEEGWGPRYAALAGPGWFDGPHWTEGRAAVGEFNVGPDDDGEADPLYLDTTEVGAIADVIEAQIARSMAERA